MAARNVGCRFTPLDAALNIRWPIPIDAQIANKFQKDSKAPTLKEVLDKYLLEAIFSQSNRKI